MRFGLLSALLSLACIARVAGQCGDAVEQVAVHLGASPQASLTVNWALRDGCTATQPRVEFGPAADNMTEIAAATARTYTVGSYTSPALFNATLGGLSAAQRIFYRAGDDACGWSCVASALTAPAPGVAGVRLAIFGDVGTTDNSVSTLQGVLAQHEAVPYAAGILLGDVSYADGVQPVWDDFGRMAQFISSKLPIQTLPGNHEWFDVSDHQFTAYRSRFSVPAQGDGGEDIYYSFKTGLFTVIMLAGYCPQMSSTGTQPCLAAGTEQRNWLIGTLNSVDRAVTPWVIVAFHQPFVNSNTAHSIAKEGLPMQAAIEDILYQYKVDAVFSGHVHAYERSCRQYQYKCVDTGPVYFTVGDGGNREGLAAKWVEPCPEWSVYRQATYGHGELEAVNATHARWLWRQNKDLTPGIIDEFYIVKGEQVPGAGACTTAQAIRRNATA